MNIEIGSELYGVYGPTDADGEAVACTVGMAGVERITVGTIPGHMAHLLTAEIWRDGQIEFTHPLHMMETIRHVPFKT